MRTCACGLHYRAQRHRMSLATDRASPPLAGDVAGLGSGLCERKGLRRLLLCFESDLARHGRGAAWGLDLSTRGEATSALHAAKHQRPFVDARRAAASTASADARNAAVAPYITGYARVAAAAATPTAAAQYACSSTLTMLSKPASASTEPKASAATLPAGTTITTASREPRQARRPAAYGRAPGRQRQQHRTCIGVCGCCAAVAAGPAEQL